jgi:serine/threonine protein kinase
MARVYTKGDEPVPGYRLVKLLGRGGFGEVWMAMAPGGTEVALKIIVLTSSHGLKEFRAIRLVKQIRHPNLVPVHAVWLKDENGNFMDDSQDNPDTLGSQSVELLIATGLGDKNLLERLQECTKQGLPGIPRDELLDYMEQAARAIDFLNHPHHQLGGSGPVAIQHCDIKPHNLIIVGDAIQVCDFGLARMPGERRVTRVQWTPAYVAPEILTAERPTDWTDQHCLAITYVELRTGSLPVDTRTPTAMIYAIAQGKLDLSKLPEPEQAVIRRATAVQPDQRFPSALDMVRALRRAEPISAPANAPASAALDTGIEYPRRFSKYELLQVLGQGRLGIVYLARHPELDLRFALKILPGALFARPEAVQRLLREARIGAILRHPHLCQVLDAGQEGSDFYIATEYVEGRTLGAILRAEGKLPVPRACDLARQLFETLAYLAGQKVVHRDVKPGNLMVGGGDQVKLLDLGLAKDLGETHALTARSLFLGTPVYVAPEQITDARQATYRADLYSAGATLFEMLTGAVPFQARTNPQLLLKVVQEPPPDPRTLCPEVPPPLAALVVRLLDKEPDKRPGHEEVLRTIGELRGTRPPAAEQPAAAGEPPRGVQEAMPAGAVASVLERIDRAAACLESPEAGDLMDWLPLEDGERRLGHYALVERLGRKGAIGTYRAHHSLTEIPVIVRVLPPAFSQMAPAQIKELLAHRGQLMQASRRSKHLARLLDVGKARLTRGTFPTIYYTVEDCLPGSSLEELIHAAQRLTPDQARQSLARAVRGLLALHEGEVLHGNLHAGKVFLDPATGACGIADLTRACAAPSAQSPGAADLSASSAVREFDWLGTRSPERRQYIAPEVLCEGERPGFLAEQYALGVAFIEALTGRFIRTHQNDLKLLNFVRADLEERLLVIAETQPQLGTVLHRMVATNAGIRYPDLRAVLGVLAAPKEVRSGRGGALTHRHQGKDPPPQEPAAGQRYDVFISYRRRSPGEPVARLIKDRLERKEFRTFLDVTGLDGGKFPRRLLSTIARTPNFLVILSDGSLQRCRQPGDWLRREIAEALATNRNIVPVMVPEFSMAQAEDLPSRLRPLSEYNALMYHHDLFDAFVERLVTFLEKPR